MTRDKVVERAILIALTQRDMCKCAEEHSLYASVCNVLEKSSVAFCKYKDTMPKLGTVLAMSLTDWWCFVEPWASPFTEKDLRKAVADAMRLAKRELGDEHLSAICMFEVEEIKKEYILDDDYGMEPHDES